MLSKQRFEKLAGAVQKQSNLDSYNEQENEKELQLRSHEFLEVQYSSTWWRNWVFHSEPSETLAHQHDRQEAPLTCTKLSLRLKRALHEWSGFVLQYSTYRTQVFQIVKVVLVDFVVRSD